MELDELTFFLLKQRDMKIGVESAAAAAQVVLEPSAVIS